MQFQIIPRQFDGSTVQTVNARELHSFLESRQDFSTWIKARIEQYGFVENSDYLLHSFMEQLPSGAKQKIDYHITIDMAKELAMVERNDKGREARKYFIRKPQALHKQLTPHRRSRGYHATFCAERTHFAVERAAPTGTLRRLRHGVQQVNRHPD